MNIKECSNKKQLYKTVISILTAIMLTLCFGFATIGCSTAVLGKDAIQIAIDQFGCKKILWFGSAVYNNALTSDIVYTENGVGHYEDRILPPQGGYFIFGLDKNGNEVYVVVPDCYYPEYKPTTIEWPFDYTFSEILDFAGQYGYEYADGIDGRQDEYSNGEQLFARGTPLVINWTYPSVYCESLGGRFCDFLDIQFAFEFTTHVGDDWHDYVIGQIDGKLMIMEIICNDTHNPNLYTYERVKQDAQS